MQNEVLKLLSHCPVCETRYNPVAARELGEDGDTRLMHVTCRKCGNAILAMVLLNRVGVSSVGLVTDLTAEDVLRFRKTDTVTIDDVIHMHAFLDSNRWQALVGTVKKRRIRARS